MNAARVCVYVCLSTCLCLWLLLEEGKFLLYSFILFLFPFKLLALSPSLSHPSLFPLYPNPSSIPPLHCCYAWWILFVASAGLAWQLALVCLVINCVMLYLPLGIGWAGVGCVPACPNWFWKSHLHFIAPRFQSGFSPESICVFTVSFTANRKDSLSPPHTLNLFFGIEVTTAWMLRNIKVPFPPTHMQQCIFTPSAFLSFSAI